MLSSGHTGSNRNVFTNRSRECHSWLCVSGRWEQRGRQRWEGVLEDRPQGSLGHPHTWPDAATGVWRLLLHARYQIIFFKKRRRAHVNMQLTHFQGNTVLPPRVTLKDETLLWPCFFFFFNVSCTLSNMTHADRMHFTFTLMRYSLRLSRRNGAEMCVRTCVCVGVRGVTWPEHRALRFHEIVCIREVRKTKCYFFEVLWPSAGYVSMERTDS